MASRTLLPRARQWPWAAEAKRWLAVVTPADGVGPGRLNLIRLSNSCRTQHNQVIERALRSFVSCLERLYPFVLALPVNLDVYTNRAELGLCLGCRRGAGHLQHGVVDVPMIYLV